MTYRASKRKAGGDDDRRQSLLSTLLSAAAAPGRVNRPRKLVHSVPAGFRYGRYRQPASGADEFDESPAVSFSEIKIAAGAQQCGGYGYGGETV